MTILETFKTALIALNLNKLRAALTMLGVIIGVFSVVTLVSIGKGLQNYIGDEFESLGANLLFVAPGKVKIGGDPAKTFTRNKLDEKHLNLIKTYSKEYIKNVAPSVRVSANVRYKNKLYEAAVTGGSEETRSIFKFNFVSGQFYTRNQTKSKKRVAILGHDANKNLFGKVNSVGKKIIIQEDVYTVIGFVGPRTKEFDDNIYIPYTSFKDTFNVENFSGLNIAIKDTDNADLAIKSIEKALLRDLDSDEFSVFAAQDILASVNNILNALTMGLGAIAGISLIVGGIGIMNIMLVSVTERTSEIGLRKALGATSVNIGLQFLIESVLLSLSGGILGLFLGFLATLIAQNWIRAQMTFMSIVLALGFSVFVGIIFGTYPAFKASKKSPIEALRYE